MPTLKEESFSFGGVDSRSNPANFPPNRALRCLNWTPQASGALRLRQGYTVPSGTTADGHPIHSAIYYEQFAAAYLGPQYVMYGKGTSINLLNMATSGLSTIGGFSTSNPWGHFRAENRIFIADGVSNYNWDGTTLRVTGIPAMETIPFGSTLSYASNATGSGWTNPTNAEGAPDGSYATATCSTLTNQTPPLRLTNYGFLISTLSIVLSMTVTVTAEVTTSEGDSYGEAISAQIAYNGAGFGLPYFNLYPVIDNAGSTAIAITGFTGLTNPLVNSTTFGVILTGYQVGEPDVEWSIDAAQIFLTYGSLNGDIVSVTSSSLGSIAPTQLSGYQLYAAIYDPVTQHMGNCAPIGPLTTVSATLSAFIVEGLPALSAVNSEWEYALGMTNDGGQVPYWFVDAQGNNIVLGNSATMGTVYIGNVNALQELPFRNDVPRSFDKFARVGTRIFAGLGGNPYLSYSNDAADVTNANYVGVPEESWPADQQEPLPTGELPTSIHAYQLEGWFFSRNNLCIWSQFLLQQGANPWRGPWPGGCVGQRAFIETPHGPFWFNAQRQLCTFMGDGVISVSDEYEASLLAQIAYPTISQTELAYLLDKESLTDEIVISGLDSNGNPVVVVHDFTLQDERSEHGQGYDYLYTGLNIDCFVGSGFTPRQNVFDMEGRQRIWAGSTQGFFAQIEDGLSDNTNGTISGDYLGLVGLGKARRSIEELEYQGDPQLSISYLPDYSLGLGDFIPVTQDPIGDNVETQSRFGAKLGGEETRWVYLRMQLNSHPADGSYALTNPPFLPLPTYGCVNESVLKLGAERKEAR
jgi:hypothetical protein